MRTLVGAADFEPTLPHGLFVLSGTTTTAATAYTFVTTQPQAPSAPREREPYRTTAFVDQPREIEP